MPRRFGSRADADHEGSHLELFNQMIQQELSQSILQTVGHLTKIGFVAHLSMDLDVERGDACVVCFFCVFLVMLVVCFVPKVACCCCCCCCCCCGGCRMLFCDCCVL